MSHSPSSPSSATVLLALTHEPSAALLADRLRRKDAHVHRLDDGIAAQNAIQESTFSVVVAETRLPGRTGLELLNRLSRHSPPFVLLGRQGNNEGVIRAFELGAADYITLPFSPRIATARIMRVPRLVSAPPDTRVFSQ